MYHATLHLPRRCAVSCAPASRAAVGRMRKQNLLLSVTFIFVRVALRLHRTVLDRITDTAKASNIERTEAGYESMDHFIIHTEDVAGMLRTIDFHTGEDLEDSADEGLEDLTTSPALQSGEAERR